MTISFKNVGVRTDSVRQNVLTRNESETPIGIRTPLELDTFGKEIYVMNYDIKDQIKDNLKNLLLTNHGERVMLHDFGANLTPLTAEYSSNDDFTTEAMIRINTAISKWMPFVTPLEFDANPDRDRSKYIRRIRILIIYAVPSLGIQRDRLELELSVL